MIVIIVKRMIRKPNFRSDHANIWVWRLVWDLSGKVAVILIILIIIPIIILIIPIIILSIIFIILSIILIILIIIFFAVVIIMSMILLGRWAEVLATKFSGEGTTLTKFDLIVENFNLITDKIIKNNIFSYGDSRCSDRLLGVDVELPLQHSCLCPWWGFADVYLYFCVCIFVFVFFTTQIT